VQSMIILTINGEIFFFEDIGFTLEEKKGIQNIAQILSQESLNQTIPTENEICKCFVNEVESCLGISLTHVEVSFVARINCKMSV
jgi:hypothetical protein